MKNVKNLKVYETALIVVDMVNGFVNEGVLHDKNIKKIVPRQLELLEEAEKKGSLIILVKDTHNKNATEFIRFGNTTHCIKGTSEAELIDELKPFEQKDNVITVEKNSTSLMESPEFREIVKQAENLKEVNFVGCCTDICVFNGAMGLANYYDQWNRDVTINVHEDAIATYSEDEREEYVQSAKLLMKQQGINLVSKKR
ncbi:MAG: isochorismatase family cysteine hydrolase [Bacilli bacterium]|nr:isochorismatase family cysteine hydrolase [Bacilli bacterium]